MPLIVPRALRSPRAEELPRSRRPPQAPNRCVQTTPETSRRSQLEHRRGAVGSLAGMDRARRAAHSHVPSGCSDARRPNSCVRRTVLTARSAIWDERRAGFIKQTGRPALIADRHPSALAVHKPTGCLTGRPSAADRGTCVVRALVHTESLRQARPARRARLFDRHGPANHAAIPSFGAARARAMDRHCSSSASERRVRRTAAAATSRRGSHGRLGRDAPTTRPGIGRADANEVRRVRR